MHRSLRNALFDVTSQTDLMTVLKRAYPEQEFYVETDWRTNKIEENETIPVWFFNESRATFEENAPERLRLFLYPLVASGKSFVLAFPFARATLEPKSLDLDYGNALDLEDIGHLLHENALDTTYRTLESARGRIALTPIEVRLAQALSDLGIKAQAQAQFGRFRPDFLIEHNGRRLVVEADGHAFHNAERDANRDHQLRALGVDEIIRFTGSQIYRDASGCAQTVKQALNNARPRLSLRSDTNLDESQKSASQHLAGPARILAPAGAGKTKTIVAHAVTLIQNGVPPGSILVLAFNKKAAEQMESRFGDFRVPVTAKLCPPENGVVCATFNAFGDRFQRQVAHLKIKVAPGNQVWREVMQESLDARNIVLGKYKPVRGSDPIGLFLKAVDRAKADLQGPDQDVEIDSFSENGNPLVPFAPIWREFQNRQLKRNIQSFDDQVYLTVRYLLKNEVHRRDLQQRFEHILVDEFQDLNAAQLLLIDIVSRPHRNLYVVGDDDQLIYGWRFAKPSNILDFHDRVPPRPYSKTYTLSTNYRCSRAIVEASRRLIENNHNREPKDFGPSETAKQGSVLFAPSEIWAERGKRIVEFLRREKEKQASKWQEMAVLCRYKSQQLPVAMILDADGIPRSPLLRYRLYTHKAARVVRAYVDLIRDLDGADADGLKLVLNVPERYINKHDVNRILNSVNPWGVILNLNGAGQLAPKSINAFVDIAEDLSKRWAKMTAAELVNSVTRDFGLEDYWSDKAKPAGAPREQDESGPREVLRVLQLLAQDFPDVVSFLGQWDKNLEAEVKREGVADDELIREEPADADHVVIGTIHSSKGREYKSVVLVDFDPDLGKLSPAELEEERRVLYVGVTRARESLLVTIDKSKPVNRLVRELIAPEEEGDKHVDKELKKARGERKRYFNAMEKASEELEAFKNGKMEEAIGVAIQRKQGELDVLRAAISAGYFEYEGMCRDGDVPFEHLERAALMEEVKEIQKRRRELEKRGRELAGYRLDSISNGGWVPSSAEERMRWEVELKGLEERVLFSGANERVLRDKLQDGNMMWQLVSGRKAQRALKEINEEIKRLEGKKTAMRQLSEIEKSIREVKEEKSKLEKELKRTKKIQFLVEESEGRRVQERKLQSLIEELSERLRRLKENPGLVSEEILEKRRELKEELDELESAISRKESRRNELSLLQ